VTVNRIWEHLNFTKYGLVVNPKLVTIGKKAFHDSIPIMFGYVPTGVIFGILFTQVGGHWWLAFLSALVIYAGAAQFLSIEMYKSHASIGAMFFTIFFLNIRHVFYGFSFLRRYKKAPFKPFLIYGLSDETYSVLTSKKITRGDSRYCLFLTFFNYLYWAIGCLIGAFIGSRLEVNTSGFEFILTALFTVLTIEQWFSKKRWFPFLVGGVASLLSLLFARPNFLVCAMFTATLALFFYSRYEQRKKQL
jgi:branched chain amino acid efflux pump